MKTNIQKIKVGTFKASVVEPLSWKANFLTLKKLSKSKFIFVPVHEVEHLLIEEFRECMFKYFLRQNI